MGATLAIAVTVAAVATIEGAKSMSTALILSLLAVAMSLFAVFISTRAKQSKKRDGGDGGTTTAGSDSGSDCGTSDGGSCDGGGGGGD